MLVFLEEGIKGNEKNIFLVREIDSQSGIRFAFIRIFSAEGTEEYQQRKCKRIHH